MRKTLLDADYTSDIIKTLRNLRRLNSFKSIRLSKSCPKVALRVPPVSRWSKLTIRIWKTQLSKSDITTTAGLIDRALVL